MQRFYPLRIKAFLIAEEKNTRAMGQKPGHVVCVVEVGLLQTLCDTDAARGVLTGHNHTSMWHGGMKLRHPKVLVHATVVFL